MKGFVQIIEFKTSQPDELNRLMDEWEGSTGEKRTAQRAVVCADRDRPGHYFELVEFPSYDAAMENSDLPETKKFADQFREICDGEPTFYNLDLTRAEAL